MTEVCEICGTKVTGWSARFQSDSTFCKACFGTDKIDAYLENKTLDSSNAKPIELSESTTISAKSNLPAFFTYLAWLALIGSCIFGLTLIPSGYSPPAAAYASTIVWVVSGVVQFALFLAIGKILSYLEQIVENTSPSK